MEIDRQVATNRTALVATICSLPPLMLSLESLIVSGWCVQVLEWKRERARARRRRTLNMSGD